MNITESIKQLFRELYVEKQYSQRKIGKVLNLTPSQVNGIIKNSDSHLDLSVKTVERIFPDMTVQLNAKFLGSTVGEQATQTGEIKPTKESICMAILQCDEINSHTKYEIMLQLASFRK